MIRPLLLRLRFALALLGSPFLCWGVPQAMAADQTVTLKAGEILRGRFVQDRTLTGFSKPVRSEGQFVLVPGRGLLWIGQTPFPVTTIITAGGISQRVAGQETMRLSAAKAPFLGRMYDIMSGVLAGNRSALTSGFTLQTSPLPTGQKLTLTPVASSSAPPHFQSLVITAGTLVETVDVLRGEGDYDTLHFMDQQVSGTPLTPDEAALFATGAAP